MSEINWLVTRKETLEAIFQCYRNLSGTHGGYKAAQWLDAYASQYSKAKPVKEEPVMDDPCGWYDLD